jgi:GNAT superfamily N-acetyltransferase
MSVDVREVSSYEQLEQWAAVRTAISVEDPHDVQRATFLRAQEVTRVDLLGYVGGEPVGTGLLSGDPLSSASPHPFLDFGVLTEYRGRGVGTALLRELSNRARLLGKAGLTAECKTSDVESVSYLERRGFVEIDRWRRPTLDLRELGPEEPLPPGIELVWLAERPDLISGMYQVAAAVYPELSGYVARQADTLTDWRTYEFSGPAVLLELAAVALEGERVVGFGTVLRVDETTVFQRMLAVAPECRGRGVGRAILLAQAHAARAAGYLRFESSRRVEGEPGLRAEVGFTPTTEFAAFRCLLVD